MTRRIMDWDSGEWTTKPVSVTKEGLHLKVESREGSDYWEKTLYGFQRDSGHSRACHGRHRWIFGLVARAGAGVGWQRVTIRASRLNDAVIIRARTGKHPWRTVRVAPFPAGTESQAGPFVCSPTRTGLNVTFTHWVRTEPDSDIHVDPPIEAEV